MAEKLKPFTTIVYVTKDGENCTATKNNGVVTIQGDKNGVRQVSVDEFFNKTLLDVKNVNLERTPTQDTVSFSGSNNGTELTGLKIGSWNQPKQEKNNKRGWLMGLATLVGVGAIYGLTRGKVKPKAVAGLADDAAHVARPVVDDVARKSKDVAEVVAEEIVPKVTPKQSLKVKPQKSKVQTNPTIVEPKVTPKKPKQTACIVENIDPIAEVAAKNDNMSQVIAPLTVTPKAEKIVTAVADDVKPTKMVDDIIGGATQKTTKSSPIDLSPSSVNIADDVTQGSKLTGITDDLGYVADDAVDVTSRGMYGQDVLDPSDMRNYEDILSPYYKPNTDPLRSSMDDMLDPYGFGSSSSYGFSDSFNPFN